MPNLLYHIDLTDLIIKKEKDLEQFRLMYVSYVLCDYRFGLTLVNVCQAENPSSSDVYILYIYKHMYGIHSLHIIRYGTKVADLYIHVRVFIHSSAVMNGCAFISINMNI